MFVEVFFLLSFSGPAKIYWSFGECVCGCISPGWWHSALCQSWDPCAPQRRPSVLGSALHPLPCITHQHHSEPVSLNRKKNNSSLHRECTKVIKVNKKQMWDKQKFTEEWQMFLATMLVSNMFGLVSPCWTSVKKELNKKHYFFLCSHYFLYPSLFWLVLLYCNFVLLAPLMLLLP